MASQSIAPAQPGLPFDEPVGEEAAYLAQQLVTYIGNKRALLGPIEDALENVQQRLGKSRLRILDAFSGSGVVTRLFKRHADELVANDLEDYARVVSSCYLTNRADFPEDRVRDAVARLNRAIAEPAAEEGFIERLYAPRDDEDIQHGERVFYTRDNARRLDRYRTLIGHEPPDLHDWLLGPLLSEASVHANTAGVFKGFYKDRDTGVGRFGGSGENALTRILGQIRLEIPVLSAYESDWAVRQADANVLVEDEGGFDLVYVDPPYNQHPYGSNYFMLNLIVNYREPREVSSVSGIPTDWQRSQYNVRSKSLPSLDHLLRTVDARFALVSYNDEGFIPIDDMRSLLGEIGPYEEIGVKYNAYRGSRNLRNRSAHVTEHLFLVDKR